MLFIIAFLATWRITHLIVKEDGPGDIIVSLRLKVGDNFFGKIMDCFLCCSIWVSIIPALFISETIVYFILNWFALSGAACIIFLLTEKE